MPNFNLEKALTNWRRQHQSEGPLEPGYLAELESGLLDRLSGFYFGADAGAKTV